MFQPSLFSMDNFQSQHMSRTNINPYHNHMNFPDNSNNMNSHNMCNVANVQQHAKQPMPQCSPYNIHHTQDCSLLLHNNHNPTSNCNVSPYEVNLNAFGSEIKPILNISSITNNDQAPFQCADSAIYNNNNYGNNPPSIRPQIEDNHSNSTMSSSSNSSFNNSFIDSKNFNKCTPLYADCTPLDMSYATINNWDGASAAMDCVDSNMSNMSMNNGHYTRYSAASYSHSNNRNNMENFHSFSPSQREQQHLRDTNHHCVIHGSDMNPSHTTMDTKNNELNFSIPIRIINAVNKNNPSPSTASDSNPSSPNVDKKEEAKSKKKKELAPHVNIECAICGAICATRQILIQHSQHYHKKICGYCGKKFARNSNLKEHIRIHTGFTPYVCSVCHRGFKQQHSLKDHIRTHTGEKPFQCDLCGKRFTVKNNLKVHMRVHTGEKPYQCTVCYKRFTQKGSLNTHLRKVHKVRMQFKK